VPLQRDAFGSNDKFQPLVDSVSARCDLYDTLER